MRKPAALLLCSLIAAAGCGDGGEPAEPASVRAGVSSLLPPLIDDSSDALDAAGETGGVSGFRSSMAELNRSYEGLPFSFPLAGDTAARIAKIAPQPAGERPGTALARWLDEHVFIDEEYEGDGVYRVRGAQVCPVADGATAPDPDCVRAIDDAELRLRVTRAPGGGLDLALQVGPERAEPLWARLRSASIDLELDLAQARQALAHLARVAGTELDLPPTMHGTVALTLTRLAARHVEIVLAVRSAVDIAGSMDQGPYALSVAARDPSFTVELDAPARRFTASVDLGPVALRAPWQAVSPDSLAVGQMTFDLRAVKGKLVADAQSLKLTGAGLGDRPLTVALDGHTLFALRVSRFDLEIVPTPGWPRFLFDPGLGVGVTVALKPLADAGDAIDGWALDELFTIAAGQEIQPVAGGVKAVRGPIAIGAARARASVLVPEGKCLLGSPLTEGEHPILGRFAAGPCP